MQRKHGILGSCGAAALLLLAGGSAQAEPRIAEIGRITVDGDKAELSGDIEVGGELVGSWELALRRVEAQSDGLVLIGRMTGTLETGSAVLKESVDDVRVALTDPQAVCGELLASAGELRFDRLGLVIYNLEREADVAAKTARGRALTSLLCAATHVIDGEDPALLPALDTVAALATREIVAIAPPAGARRPSTTAQAAAPAAAVPPTTVTVEVTPPATVDPGLEAAPRVRPVNTSGGPRVVHLPPAADAGTGDSTVTVRTLPSVPPDPPPATNTLTVSTPRRRHRAPLPQAPQETPAEAAPAR